MTSFTRHARLIDSLVEGLGPVRRLPHPGLRALGWVAFVVLSGLLLARSSDLAGLRDRIAATPEIGIAMLGSAITAALAAWAALQSTVPGHGRQWGLLPLPGLLLWAGASGLGCLGQTTSGSLSFRTAMGECLPFVVLVSLPISAVLILMLRRGYATRPGQVGVLAGLAAAAAAATLLNLFHPFDVAAMDLLAHALAVVLVCCAGWACGRGLSCR